MEIEKIEAELRAKATQVNPAKLRAGDEVCYLSYNRGTELPEVILGEYKGRNGQFLVVEGWEETEDGLQLERYPNMPAGEVYLPTLALLEASVACE